MSTTTKATAVGPVEMLGVLKGGPVAHEVAVKARARLQRMLASPK